MNTTSRSKQANRTASLLMVGILLGAALAVMPTAQAAGVGVIKIEDGNGDPELGTVAGRQQTDTFRKIWLRNDEPNDGTGRVITEVTFSVPESGDSPKKSIEWNAQTSSAANWVDNINNGANPNVVTFVATNPSANGIQPQARKAFNLGFDVFGNPPDGSVFEVTVTAKYGTVKSQAISYKIAIDSAPPTVLPTGVITLDKMDGGIPNKPDGKVDHILVIFSEPIDESTFVRSDFRLAGRNITSHKWLGVLEKAPSTDESTISDGDPSEFINNKREFGRCPVTSAMGCSVLELSIAEGRDYDTGKLPQFTTVANNLRDIAGNPLAPIGTTTVTEVDGAHPVLVSALAKDLDDTNSDLEGVRLTFSEPVRGTAALSVSWNEFTWDDKNVPPAGGKQQPFGASDWVLTHPPGDAAPGQTELVELQFASPTEPLKDADVDINKDPDTIACTADIRDLSSSGFDGGGLPCIAPDPADPTTESYAIPVEVPSLIEAEVNIDSDKITLTFNVPVSDASGDTVPIRATTFDIVPTDGGGPQGIDNVIHSACTDIVVLELDQPVKPTDVDKTPSHVRVAADRIKGCGSGAANPLYVPATDRPLVDATSPGILAANTIDEDKDGIIDGFFLQFNEPIDDSTYCFGKNPCPHSLDGSGAGMVEIRDADGLFILSADCFPEFYYDTDLAVNDRFAMIKWDQPTAPCDQDGDGVDDAAPVLDTGMVPHLLVQAGLLVDLATAFATNQLTATTENNLIETDGAAPIILTAHTVDSETRYADEATLQGTPCIVGKDRLCEEDPDGYLDGYRIVFSEAIRDDTFIPSDWTVQGHTVLGTTTDYRDGDLKRDRLLVFRFSEKTNNATGGSSLIYNTDAKPQLLYKQGSFADLAGNLMIDVNEFKVFEEDGARPVIVDVEGFVNQTELTVTFSEPVDDGVGANLVRSDLVYSNGNSAPPGTPLEKLRELDDSTSGFNNTFKVVHKAGDKVAKIKVNRPLTSNDIAMDMIGAQANSIRESTFSVVDKQYVLTTFKPLDFQRDIVPPGEITELLRDKVTANSMTLRWVAPGDDGQSNDAVSGYVFKVSKNPIMFFNDTDIYNETGVPMNVVGSDVGNLVFEMSPADMAEPGDVQRVRIAGLDPDTEYYVAVRAVDNSRNDDNLQMLGPLGSKATVAIRTNTDVTGPTGVLNLRSTTHPVNRPVLATVADFQWDPLVDPESDVVYHYSLDQKADKQVTRADQLTLANTARVTIQGEGTYYFHLRGFSAGGEESATTHYKLIVGHNAISKNAIRDYNLELHDSLRVVRVDETNELTWNLPDPKSIGEIESVRVWRLEGGAYTLVATEPGDFVSLRDGQYVDDSESAVKKSHYTIDAVFATNQSGGQPSLATYRPVATEYEEAKEFPQWVWYLLGAGILLIIGGIVAFAVVRSRHVPPELAAGPGIDPATGLPSHTVRCPSCTHMFQAVGELPLEISCPECQTKGVLE